MTAQFVNVTEIEGQQVSAEQLFRMCHRYHWAAQLSEDKDVLEVACGAGQGLGLLKAKAKSVTAGDLSPEVLAAANVSFGKTIPLSSFGAEVLPFADTSFDIVILFEALYYIPEVDRFFSEAKRILRPNGKLLIVSANKDLYDFSPSPYSRRYLGVTELNRELYKSGFESQFWGLIDTKTVAARQRILRPVKSVFTKFGLMPKTMHGKAWMKKLFFGEMAVMPADLAQMAFRYDHPISIADETADLTHKVIYCSATPIPPD